MVSRVNGAPWATQAAPLLATADRNRADAYIPATNASSAPVPFSSMAASTCMAQSSGASVLLPSGISEKGHGRQAFHQDQVLQSGQCGFGRLRKVRDSLRREGSHPAFHACGVAIGKHAHSGAGGQLTCRTQSCRRVAWRRPTAIRQARRISESKPLRGRIRAGASRRSRGLQKTLPVRPRHSRKNQQARSVWPPGREARTPPEPRKQHRRPCRRPVAASGSSPRRDARRLRYRPSAARRSADAAWCAAPRC